MDIKPTMFHQPYCLEPSLEESRKFPQPDPVSLGLYEEHKTGRIFGKCSIRLPEYE